MKQLILALFVVALSMPAMGDSINLNSSRSNPPSAQRDVGPTNPACVPWHPGCPPGPAGIAVGDEGTPSDPIPGGCKTCVPVVKAKTKAAPASGTGTITNDGSDRAVTVKGSKSNSDNVSADKTTTINNSKSNSFREASPQKSDNAGGANATTTINTSKSNNLRNASPQKSDNAGGANATTTINTSKSNTFRAANQQPGNPQPLESINLNSSRSNIYRQANPQPGKAASGQVGIAVDDPDASPADKFKFSK